MSDENPTDEEIESEARKTIESCDRLLKTLAESDAPNADQVRKHTLLSRAWCVTLLRQLSIGREVADLGLFRDFKKRTEQPSRRI